MHLEPFSHFVRSMRSAPMTWHNSLAELIDNALDSDASRVDVKMEGKTATVRDDGNGCPNVEAMLTLGGHVRQSDSGVGLYGRGLKDAWFWMSNQLHLATNHKGVKRCCVIDALALEQSNWQADDPIVTPTNDKGKDGMMATADLNGKRVKVNLDHPYIDKIWGVNIDAVVGVVFGTWCSARFATADAHGNWSDALKTACLRRESHA